MRIEEHLIANDVEGDEGWPRFGRATWWGAPAASWRRI